MDFDHGITLVGNGNVAWHFGYIFQKLNIPVNAFLGRNYDHIREMGDFFHARILTDFSEIPKDSDLILLCISDSALPYAADKLIHSTIPVAHTAACIPISVLGSTNPMTGVFYPFQSFTKSLPPDEIGGFPIFLEASTSHMSEILLTLASKITDKVLFLTAEQRLKLHLAGVLVNNFTNYIYSSAFRYLRENELDANLLMPLIKETTRKLDHEEPENVQTGPARRGNQEVLESHLKMLSKKPELRELYILLSQGITDFYNKKE